MTRFIRHRMFIGTFLFTYFLFFVVTVLIFEVKSEGPYIGFVEYGFPFSYYSERCFGGYFSWV